MLCQKQATDIAYSSGERNAKLFWIPEDGNRRAMSTMASLGSHQQCRYQAPPASRCVRQHLSSCSLCGNMCVFFHSGPCTDDAPAQKRIRTLTPSPFLLPNFNPQCSSGSESWNSASFPSLSSPATWKLGAELRASDHCIRLMTWPNTSLCFL